MAQGVELSVVIPVFNEETILDILFTRMEKALAGIDYELVFVNDGSQDRTVEIIRNYIEKNPRARLIDLSRNFGQYLAVSAGMAKARGRAVLTIDADMQDPPELVSEMLKKWREGFDVVIGSRKSRPETGLKKIGLRLFDKFFSWMSDYPILVRGGFALMDRKVVDQIVSLPERHRYIPGLRGWVGFKQTEIWYDREARAGGETKWSFFNLAAYALDAIFSFSHKPLRVTWVMGLIISAICFGYGLVLVVLRIFHIAVVPGFTTLAFSLFFLGGVQLIAIGILGEYLARVYDEVKRRPLYIVAHEYPEAENRG
jgi:polyisoprenyl-phosphate glycosyltransferase